MDIFLFIYGYQTENKVDYYIVIHILFNLFRCLIERTVIEVKMSIVHSLILSVRIHSNHYQRFMETSRAELILTKLTFIKILKEIIRSTLLKISKAKMLYNSILNQKHLKLSMKLR